MKITVAGVGYVGLSLAALLAQNHEVTAITTTEAKAEKLNQFISPIRDDEIERFFAEARAGERKLDLHTTVDKAAAYAGADLVIIATPTNYDDVNNFFDTSAVEDAIFSTALSAFERSSDIHFGVKSPMSELLSLLFLDNSTDRSFIPPLQQKSAPAGAADEPSGAAAKNQ